MSACFIGRAKGGCSYAAGLLFSAMLTYLAAALFAPQASAQQGCDWFGSRPFCDGQCPSGFVYTGRREACLTGSRRYCCPEKYTRDEEGRTRKCRWVGDPPGMVCVKDYADPEAVPYAAIAVDGKGNWGASIQPASDLGPSDTERRARSDALRRCGSQCNVMISGKGRCVAVSESREGGYWIGYAHGTDKNFVIDGATKSCTDRAPRGGCLLQHVNCLDPAN
ncbi:MAG: DUF4189 domain-containing protein [Lysobacter sp.]|nr:MAG: DUF4189 domain-containing protein [Lysobacter sp.]